MGPLPAVRTKGCQSEQHSSCVCPPSSTSLPIPVLSIHGSAELTKHSQLSASEDRLLEPEVPCQHVCDRPVATVPPALLHLPPHSGPREGPIPTREQVPCCFLSEVLLCPVSWAPLGRREALRGLALNRALVFRQLPARPQWTRLPELLPLSSACKEDPLQMSCPLHQVQ